MHLSQYNMQWTILLFVIEYICNKNGNMVYTKLQLICSEFKYFLQIQSKLPWSLHKAVEGHMKGVALQMHAVLWSSSSA